MFPKNYQHYQLFDYSTSETDDEPSEAMLPIPIYSPEPGNPLLPPDTLKDPVLPDPQSDVSLLDCLPICSLTMSSHAGRHRNYPHRTVPWSNPRWVPLLRYYPTPPLPTTSIIPFGPIKQRNRIYPCPVHRRLRLTKPRQHCRNHPPFLLSKGGGGDLARKHGYPVSARSKTKQYLQRQNRKLKQNLKTGIY